MNDLKNSAYDDVTIKFEEGETLIPIPQDTVIKINTEADNKPVVQKKEFEIFELVSDKDPILGEVMPLFDFENPPVDPAEFASSLVETCKLHKGLGLSANQCGFRHRVFVMGANDNYVAFYNPKLISVSTETSRMEEGCLSFFGLFLAVERPSMIEVEYQDYTGQVKTATYSGITARCFLHELDHMNGIRYTDTVKPLALQMAQKRRAKGIHKREQAIKNITKRLKQNAKRYSN